MVDVTLLPDGQSRIRADEVLKAGAQLRKGGPIGEARQQIVLDRPAAGVPCQLGATRARFLSGREAPGPACSLFEGTGSEMLCAMVIGVAFAELGEALEGRSNPAVGHLELPDEEGRVVPERFDVLRRFDVLGRRLACAGPQALGRRTAKRREPQCEEFLGTAGVRR